MSIDGKKIEGPSGTAINNMIKAGQKRSKLLQSDALKKEYQDIGSLKYWAKYG